MIKVGLEGHTHTEPISIPCWTVTLLIFHLPTAGLLYRHRVKPHVVLSEGS